MGATVIYSLTIAPMLIAFTLPSSCLARRGDGRVFCYFSTFFTFPSEVRMMFMPF